jgi:uncharacterized protein YyaL (SSP411 family)
MRIGAKDGIGKPARPELHCRRTHPGIPMARRVIIASLGLLIGVGAWIHVRSTQRMKPDHPEPSAPWPAPAVLARLPPDGGPEFNRLVFEKSPYLLQHARNPVDWHPWGEAAFRRARDEDKPVFLSVGYATCHWCHVMERESFEDEEVAQALNRYFICIKVDREERPDIDKIYMDVTQAMTGSGGWPMTVLMTADQKPFFSGTYFPKFGRHGRPGMMDLVPQLGELWKTDRARVLAAADQITGALVEMNRGGSGPPLTGEALTLAFEQLAARYDSVRGGFSRAPKFPTPHHLTFLLRYEHRHDAPQARQMVETTLTHMRRGGLYDHIGFGFHRYSTDPEWRVPHFEKMLYDQALLLMAYVEAYQLTRNESFARTAREIAEYVARDLTSPEGGFYSAEDADSEGEEGKFYLWTAAEVEAVLGAEEAAVFNRVFNIRPEGNFRDEATGQASPRNIPHLDRSLSEHARTLGVEEDALGRRLEESRRRLFAARKQRIHPLKDDKILTDWNGLMIAALAQASAALGEPGYAQAAGKAADFVLTRLSDAGGRLLKRYRLGEAGLPAHLDDYAFMVWGLTELYQATFEPRHLREALRLNDLMIAHFRDGEGGGFFLTADDGEKLLVRAREIYDGALPSGNSVAALNLLRLARLTGRTEYDQEADGIFRVFSESVTRVPSGHTQLMNALDFAMGPSFEVVISSDGLPDALINVLRGRYLPRQVALVRTGGPDAAELAALAPFTEPLTPIDGKPTAYVCRNFACDLPTTDPEQMIRLLSR